MRRTGLAAALVLAAAVLPARAVAAPPFSATSPWNAALPAGTRFADTACDASLHDPSQFPWINAAQYSIPVYAASAGDPQVTVFQNGQNWGTVWLPAAAAPAAGTDKHLVLIEPDGTHSDEFWNTTIDRPGGKIVAGAYARYDLTGSGVGGSAVTGAGPRASDVSALAGLIRASDFSSGTIAHALALAIPPTDMAKSWIWPADGEDGGGLEQSYAGAVHMGQLIAIPPSVDLSALGLSPEGLMIATALQHHGAYVVDTGGADALYAEPALEAQLAGARTDMTKIRAAMRCAAPPTVSDPYAAAVEADHPLAYYRLDDGAGPTMHAAVGANGTYFGAPSFAQPGALPSDTDPALALHGADGATIPAAPQRSVALELWVKTTTRAGTDPTQWWTGESLVDGDSSGLATDYGTSLVAGRPVFHVGDPDTGAEVTIAGAAAIADGAWHHVVATRDGATGALRLYVDGALAASGTGPVKQRFAVDGLTLGRVHDLQGDFLHASVDEVAIYNEALSADAVARHHAAGIRPPPPPPPPKPPTGGKPPVKPVPVHPGSGAAVAPSSSAIAAAVRSLAARAAKWLTGHGLRGLLGHRGWRASFTAPLGGRVRVSVLDRRRRAVAGGTRTCAKAGACPVTVKPTRKGLSSLRHVRRAKLTVRVEFQPAGRGAVVASKRLTAPAR